MVSAVSSSVRPRKYFISTNWHHSRLESASSLKQPAYGKRQVYFVVGGRKEVLHSPKRDELRIGASARMVYQVSPHGSSINSEKMLPIPPIPIFGSDHLEVDLVARWLARYGPCAHAL
jgi:hypothetical protein